MNGCERGTNSSLPNLHQAHDANTSEGDDNKKGNINAQSADEKYSKMDLKYMS